MKTRVYCTVILSHKFALKQVRLGMSCNLSFLVEFLLVNDRGRHNDRSHVTKWHVLGWSFNLEFQISFRAELD